MKYHKSLLDKIKVQRLEIAKTAKILQGKFNISDFLLDFQILLLTFL